MKRFISPHCGSKVTCSTDSHETRDPNPAYRGHSAAVASWVTARGVAFAAICLLCGALLTSSLASQASAGQRYDPTKKTDVDSRVLREQLIKGLKITREHQRQYIDSVIQRVVKKTLPVSIVYASFRYARLRHRYYPFPYFVYCLETLEKRQNN